MSVDEGVREVIPGESAPVTAAAKTSGSSASKEEMSGLQLMERLHTLAAKSAEFEERRHKFQKRQREDWRTRTQPVTLEEIHQADRCAPFVINPCLSSSVRLSAGLCLSACMSAGLFICLSVQRLSLKVCDCYYDYSRCTEQIDDKTICIYIYLTCKILLPKGTGH